MTPRTGRPRKPTVRPRDYMHGDLIRQRTKEALRLIEQEGLRKIEACRKVKLNVRTFYDSRKKI